ncbi:MAG: sensor diguanylate cyclase [Rhizorhabdus sp.]|nr:sensor diguanylate cyclase [Rhizorhabdus sp.]
MRIATITNWAYGITLLLTFSAGAAFMAAASADHVEREAIERRSAHVRIADDLEIAIERPTEQARRYVVAGDAADRAAWEREMADVRVFDRIVPRLRASGLAEAEYDELQDADETFDAAIAVQRTAMAAVDRGDPSAARAMMFGRRYTALEGALDGSLRRFRHLLTTRLSHVVVEAQREADRRDDIAKALLALTAALFLGVLYFILSRRVAIPLTRMSDVVTRMADQDYELDMPDDRRKDEIGDVTQALRMFRRNAMERNRLERERDRDQLVKDRLSRMMHRMQGCASEAELADVVARFAPQVFPDLAGHLFVHERAGGMLSAIGSWGDPGGSEAAFAAARCWGLRRGHMHWSRAGDEDVVCQHVRTPTPDAACLCMPLMAQGGTVGMLYFEERPQADQRLPIADLYLDLMAENIGMALANIQLRSTLSLLAIRDPLTGLANRRHLDETLDLALAAAEKLGQPLSCLMIDIDHFKRFNDEFGHDAGDLVMQHVGQVLQRHCRENDLACRYGGEEFTMIMPGTDAASAAERAEQIRTTIRHVALAHWGRPLHSVTVSIGVAAYPGHSDATNLLSVADGALLDAKRAGRDRVVVAGTEPRPRSPVRMV